MMNRKQMLEWVQALCFVVVDMQLYLDTHPCDEEALAYYKDAVKKYKEAKREYEDVYGPLTATSATDTDHWAWAETPLPWEGVR